MAETVGDRLRTALALKGWNQSDLVRATGIDKNTVSAIANDKTQPRPATLSAMEVALELTPGTLAGHGEDPEPPLPASRLRHVSDAELLAELTYRIERYRRASLADEDDAAMERRRHLARQSFLATVSEDSPEEDQWLAHEWTKLQFSLAEGPGWSAEDRNMHEWLCAKIDALNFERGSHHVIIDGDPVAITTRAHVAPAARAKKTNPGKQLHRESQLLGEESQDDGGMDPA